MEHSVVFVFLAMTLFGGCSNERVGPNQPPTSPARQPSNLTRPDAHEEKDALGDYVDFPACGVKIRQPEGFEKGGSFDGFGMPGTESSVMAVSFTAPYPQVAAGFTQEQMNRRGWTLESKREVTVDDLPGVLVHFEQPAGNKVFLKWSLVFGNDGKTTLVTATFPKAQEAVLSAQLKSAVLSARRSAAAPPALGADLPFTLAAPQRLKLTPGVNKVLVYTKDGAIPAKSPKDPLFIVAPSIGKVVAPDARQFAESRLRGTAHTRQLSVTRTEPITIDGLSGYESLAEAEDATSGAPLIIYQVILFDPGSYIILQRLVGAELSGEFVPEFKALARSLRRIRP